MAGGSNATGIFSWSYFTGRIGSRKINRLFKITGSNRLSAYRNIAWAVTAQHSFYDNRYGDGPYKYHCPWVDCFFNRRGVIFAAIEKMRAKCGLDYYFPSVGRFSVCHANVTFVDQGQFSLGVTFRRCLLRHSPGGSYDGPA